VKKVKEIAKTGVFAADIMIGTGHTFEDFSCNDIVCSSIDLIVSVSSAISLVLD